MDACFFTCAGLWSCKWASCSLGIGEGETDVGGGTCLVEGVGGLFLLAGMLVDAGMGVLLVRRGGSGRCKEWKVSCD